MSEDERDPAYWARIHLVAQLAATLLAPRLRDREVVGVEVFEYDYRQVSDCVRLAVAVLQDAEDAVDGEP